MKIAINGFGRIGRLVFRNFMNKSGLEVVAINDLTDNNALAHLLQYDTAHGKLKETVTADDSYLQVDGKKYRVFSEKDPEQLPWKELGIDIVLECTGRFTSEEALHKHILAGAQKVILSAPVKKGEVKTIVIGVNDDNLTAEDDLLSNASCTTNCLGPMVKVLHENFGVEKGFMSTTHAYTADQNIQDGPHRDLRRARAAAQNLVPTSTGAAIALGRVYPAMKGKLFGNAVRVPIIDGSLTELTCVLNRDVTVEEVNEAFQQVANKSMKGILAYSEAPLVSSDIIGDPHSCIFDAPLTMTQGNLVRIIGWYDNEYGYASRLADLTEKVAQFLQ
jgi:glyceraldehyde 3-phosphate dehydrogenase (phosphorylating)